MTVSISIRLVCHKGWKGHPQVSITYAMLLLQGKLQIALAKSGFAMLWVLQAELSEVDVGLQKLSCNPENAGNNAEYSTFYAGLLPRQSRYAGTLKFFDRALCLRPNAGSLRPFLRPSVSVASRVQVPSGSSNLSIFRRWVTNTSVCFVTRTADQGGQKPGGDILEQEI